MKAPTQAKTGWNEVRASVRHARTPRRDAVALALSAAQTLGAVPLLLDRKRRTSHGWRQDQSYQWRRERWNGAILEGELPDTIAPRIVWICKGIAETRLALELSRRLSEELEGTTVWQHHFALIDFPSVQNAGILPSDISASAFPFDYGPSVSRWLNATRPHMVVAVEQIWHLNLARACRARGVPLVALHVQTRQSWDRASALEKWLKRRTLEGFSALGFRSETQANFWRPYLPAASAALVTGTLKFPLTLPVLEAKRQTSLDAWLAQSNARPLVAAGSVEPKEEATILEAFSKLRAHNTHPAPALLVAPRHLERVEAIEKAAQAQGWTTSRRSDVTGNNSPPADVLLLDTMGELARAYRACCAAFVGGTFAGNGHNVFEPLASGVPVAYGPRRGIFGLEQEWCETSEVGWRVNDATELTEFWNRAASDANWQHSFAARLPAFSQQARGGWGQSLDFLQACLRGLSEDDEIIKR